jgi:hypothetical protein
MSYSVILKVLFTRFAKSQKVNLHIPLREKAALAKRALAKISVYLSLFASSICFCVAFLVHRDHSLTDGYDENKSYGATNQQLGGTSMC